MKWPAAAFGLVGAVGTYFAHPQNQPIVRFGLIGQHAGYLSPCGCTTPMSGGLLRVATEVRRLHRQGEAIVLDTGDLVHDIKRQDVLKAETVSQTFASLDVTAANVSAADAQLGEGEWLNLAGLADGRYVCSELGPENPEGFKGEIQRDGYMIGGFSVDPSLLGKRLGTSAAPLDSAVDRFLADAKSTGLLPIVMLDGTQERAIELAKRHQGIVLLTYQITGRAPTTTMLVGKVILVAPGERGEDFVSFSLQGSDIRSYNAEPMGPEVADDAGVKQLYDAYLREVAREDLWSQQLRQNGPAFAGSQKCGSCHQESYKVWKSSDHSHALATLAAQGHQYDPECMVCHVTGGELKAGFQSEMSTPQLAMVGCESCHGAGAAHAAKPRLVRMPKTIAHQCMSCHTKLNSPKFDFADYWPRIRH